MKETNDACADIVLLSNAVFSGAEDEAAPGFVAVCGERISAVGPKSEALQWIGPETKVYELGDGLVMPGIHDNHVFFTGYMSMHRGLDLSAAASSGEALDMLSRYAETLPARGNVYAFGWDAADWGGCRSRGRWTRRFRTGR
ncbi:hypothetical protein HMSSN036_79200 [Paenibacillus macerans]|nr:hypothetical protein HMSSN036_79200 [Paenibacillus macerans]